MKHEPRPAIMGWAHKLGGTASQGMSRVRQTVLARLMKSQIWQWLSSSYAVWGVGSEKGQWLLPAFLTERKLSSSSHLDTRHFSSSLYISGAFQATTLVLELRQSESE